MWTLTFMDWTHLWKLVSANFQILPFWPHFYPHFDLIFGINYNFCRQNKQSTKVNFCKLNDFSFAKVDDRKSLPKFMSTKSRSIIRYAINGLLSAKRIIFWVLGRIVNFAMRGITMHEKAIQINVRLLLSVVNGKICVNKKNHNFKETRFIFC